MRSGPSQRLTSGEPQFRRRDGKTISIADQYFKLSDAANRKNRKKFWFFAASRGRRAHRKALALDADATACWQELLLRFRPLLSNCFKVGGLTEDAAGGYASAMPNFARRFEVVAQRATGARCFAELLWQTVCDCVPGGNAKVQEYHERFHLLALLDQFESAHQGTIRTGYFFQDGSTSATSSTGPNDDLLWAELYTAFSSYADFLHGLEGDVDRLTGGVITSAMLRAQNAVDVLLAWL